MEPEISPPRRLTTRLTVILLAAICGALVLAYLFFLRADYVQAFAQLRPADASAVVAQLDAKKIPYRLADGGTTILVPADQADGARVAIAGSDVALKGGVGFELFNKSDMGLTDFAQRINYQRALQGELERSIMMIEEVESARVHLAMPERTIFRSERSSAKAAVEIGLKAGRQFDAPRVVGIQRLVAFAVPDLTPTDVVVLDGDGRVLSQAGEDDTFLSPDAEERRSAQSYYRARARAALQQTLPGIQADVRVITLDEARTDGSIDVPRAPASSDGPARTFRLRVIVATGAPLNQEETEMARKAIVAALGLNDATGDELTFRLGTTGDAAGVTQARRPQAAALPPMDAVPSVDHGIPLTYWIAALGLVVLTGGLLLRPLTRRSRLSASEREAMVERIRVALRQSDGQYVDA